jgi:hypothetical protein
MNFIIKKSNGKPLKFNKIKANFVECQKATSILVKNSSCGI